jgi:polyribonucleotide nucleotidyltransferase
MAGAIAAPRADVRYTAPKIVSFEIPVDKIGEVIGPKGKVINTIQQETGADISVQDEDGMGLVSIGSKDGAAVTEARRRIELILDPPSAEVGAIYTGRVVNITKFGAFVNILPGRDGLIHISKLGRGKRINRVEDVVDLGDEIEVRVDEIDEKGKVSLSPVGDAPEVDGDGAAAGLWEDHSMAAAMRCASPGATAPSKPARLPPGLPRALQGAGYMPEPQAGCDPRSLMVKARAYPCDDLKR